MQGIGQAPPAIVKVEWGALNPAVLAIPTYLDQVNPGTMARSSPLHDPVFARIKDLGADHIRYLHWDPFELSYPLPTPPIDGKTSWNFNGIDPYVEDFMAASAGHDSVINFAPMYRWGTNASGFVDPTGEKAGEYFSRIISWYTKGGFVDELGVKHVSRYFYNWTYWEVLNEVDAGSSGTACNSLNNSGNALMCAEKYTEIYDGIVTVLKRDHPQLEFTALVIAFPDCAGAEVWFRYFLNASNHRSPVREHFGDYVSEISYHWYSENPFFGASPSPLNESWRTIGNNSADVFVQAAQFVSAAARIQRLARELAPGVRSYVDEVAILAPDPAGFIEPFGEDRWWWNLQAAHYAYVYGELAALGIDAIAGSQLTGYPGNAASIAMLDWTNGQGTAWYWVIKMFIDTLGSGRKRILPTEVDGTRSSKIAAGLHPDAWTCVHSMSAKGVADAHVGHVYAQAMILTETHERVLLLVNTRNDSVSIVLDGALGGSVRSVDLDSGSSYSDLPLTSNEMMLKAFAVSIVRFPQIMQSVVHAMSKEGIIST